MSSIVSALVRQIAISKGASKVMASAYGSTAGGATNFVVGPFVGALENVISSEATYAMNRAATNQIPDPAHAIKAYYCGAIGLNDTIRILSNNNISFANQRDASGNFWTYCWDKIIDNERPTLDVETTMQLWREHKLETLQCRNRLARHGITRPEDLFFGDADRDLLLRNRGWYSLDVATDLWLQGVIGDADYTAAIKRAGIGEEDAWGHMLKQRQPISFDRTYTDYWTGQVGVDDTRERLSRLGYGRESEHSVQLNYQRPLTPAEAQSAFWRGLVGPDPLTQALNCDSMHGDEMQGLWKNIARPIPSPVELVTFAVRDVWDAQYQARIGGDEEFPVEFRFWMSTQGWDWADAATALPGQQGQQITWPQVYWRAHWERMSPTQAYRAYHRLRPDRIRRYADRVPGLQPFLWEDLEKSLKIADYPPALRRWLAASAFSVLPIYVVRMLYKLGRRDRDWFIDQAMDRGYSRDDAASFADAVEAQNDYADLAPQRRAYARSVSTHIKDVEEGYRIGTLSRGQAIAILFDLKIEGPDANRLLDLVDVHENYQTVKESQARLRSGYFAGEFSTAELLPQLVAMGVMQPRAAQIISRWRMQRTLKRRMASTAQLQKWVAEGKLSAAVGTARLINLGWTNPDALLLLSDAEAQHAKLEAAAVHSAELAQTRRQRQLEQVVGRCTKLRDRVQAQLRRETPLTYIKSWLTDGVVSVKWARDRMLSMGYTDEMTSNYIQDWGIKQDAQQQAKGDTSQVDQAGNVQTGSEGTGVPKAASTTIPKEPTPTIPAVKTPTIGETP